MKALFIPLFPLIAFLLLTVGRKVWSKGASALIGIIATFISLLLSLPVLWESITNTGQTYWKVPWFHIDQTVINFSIDVAPLNVLMLVIVSSVSFLVQLYSWGYMKKDKRLNTFYAYLSLFTFSMLGLVISSNLLGIYIFWELVGVCSFLLVGFWYFKPEAKAAARKAFIVTRIGDIGLFIAISLLFWQAGSFELRDLKEAVAGGVIEPWMITLTAILIFVGAVGKSGQFPLHTWLPDAMEGPTPVSALIHAATMVAAGVYLVANLFFLFQASETAMSVVAYIGGFTAIFAASIGLAQNDIKRVLAYSTVSQLGYMMLALGSAGYVAGVFHLMTHAFFKALLFLGAGAVIVSLHHEQDIRKMGGLWKKNRWLGIWFLIGCLSIAGIPPFSGFFSKDEILLSAYTDGRMGLFAVGVIAAFFTAFYMFRLFFMVFTGEARGDHKADRVPCVMMIPIMILALFTTVAGFSNTPGHWLEHWLTQGLSIHQASLEQTPLWIPFLAIAVALLGIGLAYVMYGQKRISPASVTRAVPWLYQLVYRKYYIDEVYHVLFVLPLKGFGWFLNGIDRFIVGGLVYLSAWVSSVIGQLGSRLQNGQAQTYALVSLIGFVLLIVGLTAGRLFEWK
ncbi:NADH-quinone oxidoreductase subunit L [Paenactinomyces guangxiensis]|uniref:NADH-quinone oxidoreductase subunit L n=1 Tax=Paenactinomyces guangxiensis TaxID=1490290 RepID=A0A7W1WU78_9BACL|nr:NADH-quinone oxidoreductase subunit L [Paenactinomyces guangxiensis]MBA4495971.1 NADH-quinone oxidoreductase subunit L [Paenactinomyces guangxiensis]MBH8593042.1 NADH-quinone oxidoreductase subunit L [Paenactinomyces guangxiensis]